MVRGFEVRGFDGQDQAAFAALSGDANPMHMDAEAARRLAFDRPLVHGVHVVLQALEAWLAAVPAGPSQNGWRLRSLVADFRLPVAVGDRVGFRVTPEAGGEDEGARIDVTDAEGRPRMMIRLTAESGPGPAGPAIPATLPATPCRERDEAEFPAAAGSLALGLDPVALAALVPAVAASLPPAEVAFLLATTRLVGMDCPGLHSVFSGLELKFGDAAGAGPVLDWRTERYDPRFRFLEMAVAGAGASGRVRAMVRARPVAQPTLAELRALVPAGAFAGRRALVVGGARGLGETCAKLLAAGGAEVAVTWARGRADAARVAAEIGGRALQLDVTAPAPDWTLPLAGWAPTDLCYFATPRIRPTANRRFSAAAYGELTRVYVDGFLAVLDGLDRSALGRVFYPSSVYVTEAAPRFAEYVAAKAAGEALCAALAGLSPGLRFSVPRLPRLASDQTSEGEPAAAPVLAALLLADAAPAAAE